MASGLAETAKLVASLELKDRFTPAANKAMASLGKLEGRAYRVGQNIGKGFQNAAANIAKLGLVVGAGLALAVRGGIGHLAELEDATTSVDGAIKQMALTGAVTSAQIATWANEIESNVEAAFDDKAIVSATATLLRFGKVTPSNIRPAMEVITDLAVRTGSVDSAATLLGKALADPTKAAGKLSRQGVILTKTQQDQIKAFVKAGKVAEAQKVILDSLAETTKGAAKASAGPYRDALNILADVTEDAQKALAVGFLPVLTKVAKLLSTELAKPGTLDNIRKFGEGLASGLDSLIDTARGLPWATIGTSLQIAGTGAKAVFNAFMSMPDWVKTAVLTGWGLNKLTGGALGGIAKELGGMVFEIFGSRGSSPANPLFVSQVGGLPGGATPVPGGGKVGLLGNVFKFLGVGVLAGAASEFAPAIQQAGRDLRAELVGENFPKLELSDLEWPFGPKNTPSILPEVFGGNGLLGGRPKETKLPANFGQLVAQKLTDNRRAPSDPKPGTGAFTPAKLQDSFDRAVIPTTSAIKDVTAEVGAAGSLTASASTGAGRAAAAAALTGAFLVSSAVRGARPIITNNVDIDISGTSVVKKASVSTSYGPTTSSREGNLGTFGGNGPR